MAIANENFPGSGEMSAVEAFASGSRVRATELRGLRDALSGAASDAVEGANSAAVVAWKLRMIPLKSTLNSIIGELESRASAADAYVSAVEDIRLRAQQRQSDKRDLTASLHYWHCAPYEYQQSFDGQSRLSQIYAGQRAVASALQALLSERHEADRAFTAALSDAPVVKGLSFAELSGIGSTVSATPNLVSVRRAVNVAQAQSVTRRVLENPGDEDALLAWQRELDDLGDDQAAWNMFYAENGGITGEELALSLAAFSTVWGAGNVGVGSRAADAVLASSQRLRQGLAIASASWVPFRASGFVSSMFSAVRSGSASPSTVAFLFQDQRTALQGQALTVAVAEELDQLERVEGQWTSRPHDLSQEQSLLVMAGVTPGEGWEHFTHVDLASQVLTSLSHYPESALAWLVGPGESAAHGRIEYWYGFRSTRPCGLDAPLAVSAAALDARGGMTDTVANYDQEVWETQSRVTGEVIAQVVDRPDFWVTDFSHAAATSAAEVFGKAFPQLVEGPVFTSDLDRDGASLIVLSDGTVADRPTIDLFQTQLQKLSTIIGHHPDAVETLSDHIEAYVGTVTVAFEQPDAASGQAFSREMLLDSIARAEGVTQGVSDSKAYFHALALDQREEDFIRAVEIATSAVPVPSSEFAAPVVRYLVDAGVDMSVDIVKGELSEAAREAFKTHYGSARVELAVAAHAEGQAVSDVWRERLEEMGRIDELLDGSGETYEYSDSTLDRGFKEFGSNYDEALEAFSFEALDEEELAIRRAEEESANRGS